MGEKNIDQSFVEKGVKSVFVGNIPFEATQEELKNIFCQVGPVLSFKLVIDRESGRAKGFGFCAYKDQETAQSAIRNLNGYKIDGRALYIANTEVNTYKKSRMEMQHLLQEPQVERPYGEHCEAENSPEVITKTILCLPPEQMYELMKQVKTCIQNDPAETRNILSLNPQLACALSQAQVAMRIDDPYTALSMLHNANQMPTVLTSDILQLPVEIGQPIQTRVAQPMPSDLSQSSTSAILSDVMDPLRNRNMSQDNMKAMPSNSMIQNPSVEQYIQRRQKQRLVAATAHPVPFPFDHRQRNNDPRVKTHPRPVPSARRASVSALKEFLAKGSYQH